MGVISSLIGTVVGNSINTENVKNINNNINFKLGLRRLLLVILCILSIIILLACLSAHCWIAIITVPLGALLIYGIYLILEKVFIWVVEGFKNNV